MSLQIVRPSQLGKDGREQWLDSKDGKGNQDPENAEHYPIRKSTAKIETLPKMASTDCP